MAEDLNADAVPNVVRNDSSSDSTTEPGTRTVPPTARQTNEDGSKTTSSSHNENDIHLAECGSVQNYTDTFNGNDGNMLQARDPSPMYTHKTVNPDPMHAENKVFPNPMYLHCTSEVSNASPKSAFKPSEPFQEIKSNSRTQAMDSNPMCTLNTTTPYPLHPKDSVKPDRVNTHVQSTIEPSNASPGSSFTSSMPSADIPCTLTSANTHQQEEHICQNNIECNAALSDTQPKLPSQDLPSAASNDIDDVSSNPLSNINGVLNALNPNPIYGPNVQNSAACESADRKLEKIITIGERGKDPWMKYAYGVAVSADNEIFVTHAEGVHVFSINGNYLRRFPTVRPGKNGYIMPYDVAIGVEPGHLWVVGGIFEPVANAGHVQVVTYSRIGQTMKKFDVGFTGPSSLPSIAIDVRNNKIIVGQGKTVKMFDPDGSLYRSFKVSSGSEGGMIGGVISDGEGNILLTLRHKAVEMYSHSGVKIFEFAGRGKRQYGICLDNFGNIFVADNGKHRVDMFTSRGVFVRTITDIEDPSGIAMGPDGEMVVTSAKMRSTVTIFPRHMVLP
ncbi:hypothetical protein Bbelb_388650 [Branchiostoma belcheri]|nr:hypothetical protein Bbelb_388650 [Branchiostoma belcheri]